MAHNGDVVSSGRVEKITKKGSAYETLQPKSRDIGPSDGDRATTCDFEHG